MSASSSDLTPSPVQKSLLEFPGRECRGIPALTHPSFALSLRGSPAAHITGLDPESTTAVYACDGYS